MEIKIDEKVVNYIESLDFECTARRDIISFMLKNNMDTNTESFKKYQKEYSEFLYQYEKAKNILFENNAPEELKNHQVNWNLSYETGIMKFEKMCNC